MLLSAIIFLPLLFALIIVAVGRTSLARPLAFAFATVEFVASLAILCHFDKSSAALQLVEQYPWIDNFGVTYFVGVDGISLWLVILTTILTPLTFLASWNSVTKSWTSFAFHMFVLETALVGSFLAMDAVLFYVFFELSLIPMYFIIGIWGGPRKIYATVKFFIYTMLGSVLMLLAIIALMVMTADQFGSMSASLLDFYKLRIPFVAGSVLNPQALMFFAFSLAFAIKVPLFPVHTWLPDAHVEAPTPGSVILAGVMLKLGTYGFLRFVLPLFPEASHYWASFFGVLAVIGIIYGALVAMVQPDIKKLVAYSSVSHMGYVILGLFAMNAYGLTGGLYQMLNHGVSTGALFLLVGMVYERTHTRDITEYGGLASLMPIYAIGFFAITISSIAVPGTNGFVGEFLILMGAFLNNKILGSFAVLGVILGAVYMLWLYRRMFFGHEGPLAKHHRKELTDLSWREIAVLVPLVVLTLWMGVFPQHFLSWSQASLDNLVKTQGHYELKIAGVHP
jgi:NADH-quinone oxidoreductase subunit M